MPAGADGVRGGLGLQGIGKPVGRGLAEQDALGAEEIDLAPGSHPAEFARSGRRDVMRSDVMIVEEGVDKADEVLHEAAGSWPPHLPQCFT